MNQPTEILLGRTHALMGAGRQRGVALVVALILLVVITLIGLAAVGGTILQQKMASNQYDREVAFQTTEAAMRAAQQQVSANHNAAFIRDCSASSGNACLGNPFTDPNLPIGALQTVVTGTAAGQFTVSSVASGQPQFVVEKMGLRSGCGSSSITQTGINPGPNGTQLKMSQYFRITARSGDPAQIHDRSIVILQSVVKICL